MYQKVVTEFVMISINLIILKGYYIATPKSMTDLASIKYPVILEEIIEISK